MAKPAPKSAAERMKMMRARKADKSLVELSAMMGGIDQMSDTALLEHLASSYRNENMGDFDLCVVVLRSRTSKAAK